MPRKTSTTPRNGRANASIEPTPTKRRRARSFPSYAAALRYLDDRVNIERIRPHRVDPDTFKLDRMRAALSELGDPHQAVRFVHVAGSKGKGSVCQMLASCLHASGYAVGLNTSPHLVDLRERIRLNGAMIAEADFNRLLGKARWGFESVEHRHGPATYFELVTATAFLFFAEQAVDIAVVEVGLGGRLDSTNVITPEAVGLTSIQLEHTAILGDTLEAIAAEKAGVMKPGVPAVSVKQPKEVLAVFQNRADEIGAPFAVLGKDIDFSCRFEATHDMGPHVRVGVTTSRSEYEHLPVPLPGEHQAQNCGLVLAILDRLKERGFHAPERDVARGLADTPRDGRMELVWEEPRIMVDGAHTGESVRALVQAIGAQTALDSMVVIFGCAADKDVDDMLDEIGRGADKIIFTTSETNPRAAEPADLARRFEERTGKMAQVEPSVKDAINTAARAVGRDDLICVTGSFYIAGEAKALLDSKKRELAAAGAETEP